MIDADEILVCKELSLDRFSISDLLRYLLLLSKCSVSDSFVSAVVHSHV